MKFAVGVATALVCSATFATEPVQRSLTFEDRVKAQNAIERVYYSHQLGTTKPFSEAVPRAVLESKVRKYLEQSAALNTYWKTAVTDYTLQRELERMAQGTKMPERLIELYAALGNDPFLIKESLARPALVDRLTHNFYAFDPTQHVKERGQADALHQLLVSAALSPSAENPCRTVTELVVGEAEVGPVRPELASQQKLTLADFQKKRAELPTTVGQISDIKETRDAYVFNVVLSDTATSARVANYVVLKTTWDAWWDKAQGAVRSESVMAVASSSVDPPAPHAKDSGGTRNPCDVDYWDSGTLSAFPDGREMHTAIWTGSVMVVWGGLADDALNTGSRYDPAIDTWNATSTVGAPTPRLRHTAIWSGTRMLVWGGSPGAGGQYDPIADTWMAMSTVGAPSDRWYHTVVWTGFRMVVWGGMATNSYSPQRTGGQYDPIADTWTTTSTLDAPTVRYRHTAIWTGTTMVVWGGLGYSDGENSGGRYDPSSDTWTPTNAIGAPPGRFEHTAVWTGTRMVVWGGRHGNDVYNDGATYDPETDAWAPTSTTGAPSRRTLHTATWTGNRMVVWGGYPLNEPDSIKGGRYDPATDTWTGMSVVGAPLLAGHTAVWTGSLMVVWGGRDESVTGYAAVGGRYDPGTDTWTATSMGDGPSGRYSHTAAWSGNLMLIWGGADGYGYLTSGGRYDPALDAWMSMSTIGTPSARYAHTGVWTGSKLVVWGGGISTQPYYSDTGGRYDPVSDAWAATSTFNSPTGRLLHAAVWTGHRMVVWGGYGTGSTSVYLNSGGLYDPDTDVWTPTSNIGAPVGRAGHLAVWTGRVIVVWGGARDVFEGTGGRYDPLRDSWTPTSIVGQPLPRQDSTAVWTGSLMIVWGGNYGIELNDGARYDPEADGWIPTSILGAPSRRSRHSAVWTGREMLVWGGSTASYDAGGRYDPAVDTWVPMSLVDAPLSRPDATAVWTGRDMVVWGGRHRWAGEAGFNTGGRYLVDASPNVDGDGYTECTGDCNDGDATVFPGADETCNSIDDDCDTVVDDCDDGDACTVGDSCVGVACAGTAIECDDSNPCTDDSCEPAIGCVFANNNRPCTDANPCTADDACAGGSCHGGTFACDDHNACTDDSCDPELGCVYEPYPAGTSCADGDACNGVELCDGGGFCTPGIALDCDDLSLCSQDYCDPSSGCQHLPLPAGTSCSDGNACNGIEVCTGATGCPRALPLNCDDNNPCTDDSCDPATGCVYTNNTNPCNDGNACTTLDVCGGGTCNGGTSLACDDDNPCTDDSCDPTTGCGHANGNKLCDDGDACTTGDRCGGGTCHGGDPIKCGDGNACTSDSCDPAIGCVFTNNSDACDDGNACTLGDHCSDGSCGAGSPVACSALDQCHTAGSCNPATGVCSSPPKPNGSVCDDASLCTTGETCQSGTCTPAFSGMSEPNPRTNGYYKRLCQGPHSGDQFRDTDATCVAAVAATFAGIATVADLCAVLQPNHPISDPCGKTEVDLLVLALNICRARVCTAQVIDSQCGGNGSVGQSLAESDDILRSETRDGTSCAHAKCLNEEINTGRALELNTLTLRREGSGVRLDWHPPYLDDGSGHPGKYNIWRRTQGSLAAFTKIGTTTEATFFDATPASGKFEYEVTAVMN